MFLNQQMIFFQLFLESCRKRGWGRVRGQMGAARHGLYVWSVARPHGEELAKAKGLCQAAALNSRRASALPPPAATVLRPPHAANLPCRSALFHHEGGRCAPCAVPWRREIPSWGCSRISGWPPSPVWDWDGHSPATRSRRRSPTRALTSAPRMPLAA